MKPEASIHPRYRGFVAGIMDFKDDLTIPESELTLGGRLAMRQLVKSKHPKVEKIVTRSRTKGLFISYIVRQ